MTTRDVWVRRLLLTITVVSASIAAFLIWLLPRVMGVEWRGKCFRDGAAVPCRIYDFEMGRYAVIGQDFGYVIDAYNAERTYLLWKPNDIIGPYFLGRDEMLGTPGQEPLPDWNPNARTLETKRGAEFTGPDGKHYRIEVDER